MTVLVKIAGRMYEMELADVEIAKGLYDKVVEEGACFETLMEEAGIDYYIEMEDF